MTVGKTYVLTVKGDFVDYCYHVVLTRCCKKTEVVSFNVVKRVYDKGKASLWVFLGVGVPLGLPFLVDYPMHSFKRNAKPLYGMVKVGKTEVEVKKLKSLLGSCSSAVEQSFDKG